jgi:nucleotide-binding universal stress UspA family protein
MRLQDRSILKTEEHYIFLFDIHFEGLGEMTAHILVPLDGTALAESALPLDVTLAQSTSRGITLLRAVPMPPVDKLEISELTPDSSVQETWEEELSAARDYLDNIGKRLADNGIEVGIEVARGIPAAAIVEYAEENPSVSLIAMATRNHTPPVAWAFGSVVERVLHRSPKPVLLLRPTKEEADEPVPGGPQLRTIVVPLDGSTLAEKALDEARQLALVTGATLALVTVIPPCDNCDVDQMEFVRVSVNMARDHETKRLSRYLAGTAEVLRAEGFEVRTELVYGHPAEMILLTAVRLQGDLIVMATRGRRDVERLWLGSVAQRLAQSSTVPLLLIKEGRTMA